MKGHSKLIFLLVAALVGVTLLYGSDTETPLVEARARLLATLDPTLILTTPTRTSAVVAACAGMTRTNLVPETEVTTAAGYFTTLSSYFNADPLLLMKNALAGNFSEVMAQGQTLVTGLGIYVVPFVLGLVLSLTMWTCLCCCCTCPSCCPSKCCQHDSNIIYTKC